MKAMILAAGRGKRLGALTDNKPKPLMKVRGTTLLENKITALKQAGVIDIVINVSYLADQIQDFAGDGSAWGVNICYSVEEKVLETGGGVARALPLLGAQPFILLNADIWTEYPLAELRHRELQKTVLGHLVLVDNPAENPQGDFVLHANQLLAEKQGAKKGLTYSGIALMNPDLVVSYPSIRNFFSLAAVFRHAIHRDQLSGEYYAGEWHDVGTPQCLEKLNQR